VLYNNNVFITPGGIFGGTGEQYIRVSLCGSIERFEQAISRVKASSYSLKGEASKKAVL